MADGKIINVHTDMTDEKRRDMEQLVSDAFRQNGSNKIQSIASQLKQQCDSRFGGNWHCHVGPVFGSSFPYEANTYFYAEMTNLCVLVYKFL